MTLVISKGLTYRIFTPAPVCAKKRGFEGTAKALKSARGCLMANAVGKNRDTAMSGRMVTAATALVLFVAGTPALATPPSQSGIHYVSYNLTIDPDMTDHVRISLPASLDYEEDVSISRATRSPSVFVFMDAGFDPGANTGWHYHPGIVLATVAEGSVEWYDAKCVKHVRKAGDFFTETDRAVHEMRNSGSVPARVIFTFIIAKGITYKISTPAPACAMALGLN